MRLLAIKFITHTRTERSFGLKFVDGYAKHGRLFSSALLQL